MTTPSRVRGWGRRLAAAGLVAALGLGYAIPASADQLDDRKQQLTTQLGDANDALGESSKALEDALAKLKASQGELAAAQAALAATQDKVSAAKAEDARLAGELRSSQAALDEATGAVEAGHLAIDAQRSTIGEIARDQVQQQHNLMGVAVLVQQGSVAGLQTRIQLSTTMMETSSAQLERLNQLQAQLEAAEAAQAAATAKVAADRAAAAQVVVSLNALMATQTDQQSALAAAVQKNQSAQAAAQSEVAQDTKAYQDLSSERDKVNADIAARDEAARKAAEAQAEADRKAREAAAAQAAAAAAAAAKSNSSGGSGATATAGSKSSSSSATSSNRVSSAGLASPIPGAPITSPYGMRVHPITGVYKLHDGTDFGAGCGTPIRAAAAGRVTQRYYNAGYGNRLFLDHGSLGGARTVTSYNHLSSYAVSVGQWVNQGQVIGYVGATGYATGCHLHFMVWRNGQMVNPATVL
ncbi:peptidoglycan DD-metalloendopeptidase family protein [Raineyella fluvialis]|uniref:Peptidoglycan DD-metalloendopeptidase family protein n=1 Tax=Raineyella fluvialis TaxID=2662261 RepID=A0A5Q2FBX3_9ACTN|nr:peptidoglycan DD-metalloendopeptidase family protein [Raineyella fluvialis]QGF24392.1 peptidoglycan DD-metalloendopeptidase family protein [Raineyella fluvialis]